MQQMGQNKSSNKLLWLRVLQNGGGQAVLRDLFEYNLRYVSDEAGYLEFTKNIIEFASNHEVFTCLYILLLIGHIRSFLGLMRFTC